jgi:hypothetical protein
MAVHIKKCGVQTEVWRDKSNYVTHSNSTQTGTMARKRLVVVIVGKKIQTLVEGICFVSRFWGRWSWAARCEHENKQNLAYAEISASPVPFLPHESIGTSSACTV